MWLKLGFFGEDFGYCIVLGLLMFFSFKFVLDLEIKWECIWVGFYYWFVGCLVDCNGLLVKVCLGCFWEVYVWYISSFESIFNEIVDLVVILEIFLIC